MKNEFDEIFENDLIETTTNDEPSLDSSDESAIDEQNYDPATADLLKLYLREASRTPMLDAAGEIKAARHIERAINRLMKLLPRSPITAEYAIYLRQAFRRGDETASDIIEQIKSAPAPEFFHEAVDLALNEVENAHLEVHSPKRKPSKRTLKKYAKSFAARQRIKLHRGLRNLVFTPASERHLMKLLEAGASIASQYLKKSTQPAMKSAKVVSLDAVRASHEATFTVGPLVSKAILENRQAANGFVRLSQKVNAA